ncbi:hypothetical protein [Tenacibaculum finnmarkense]|uniref:hypothetical protein n=1 Tax=Tenacibaculum finnmarkense TaxID=2781243 RepID=UPI000C42F385|nr:hypothetical protein [Tenacibaculum finnmarkense]MCD8440742.1 hypothetical protein [Tenacibaculum finnmarkense genomovar ulcerans]MCG8208294.1 hypothetical protein [Tenacibaculum finnmarkense genomovar finnmarkense]MCG8721632.1 hypothetical protein [Tenacibaculum finnmarkense]MCM8907422.1 hypothetical protein [Tenacibaculum finnmarkense genomovar finnmarkense]SOS55529.1 hypothetical protein TFHFJT_310020 [Tenacibaculum finnmarkense]
MAFIDNVKPWFKTYLKPTQAQFYRFFEFIRWKDEEIPVNDVSGLNNLLIAKVDKEAFNTHLRDTVKHVTQAERKKWNSGARPFNLRSDASFLKYKYFGKKVFGILLQIPEKVNNEYVFTHNLNITKYLRLEVWENGLPFDNPKMRAREDLSALIYKGTEGKIGESPISTTPIGASLTGDLQLSNSTIQIESDYVFPNNKLLYIEFIK